MESRVSCNFNDYGWQSLGCCDRVVHKWLNISTNNSDYSADVDDSVCDPVGAGIKTFLFCCAVVSKLATAATGQHTMFGDALCPVCGFDPEFADHLLVRCTVAKTVWWWISVWLKVPILSVFNSVTMILAHCHSLGMEAKKEKIIYAIFLLTMWKLWRNRNGSIFDKKFTSVATLVDDIKVESFCWMVKQSKLAGLDMERWCRF